MGTVLDLERIAVVYARETVLSDFSMSVDRGEIVGIYGPNGSGKSTVLAAVSGLARVIRGRVAINQTILAGRNGPALRKHIGYVPQHFEVDAGTPVLAGEVVLMGRYGKIGVFHFPRKADLEITARIMDQLEIADLKNQPFGHLSGGQKKRFLIARALAQEPEILLLDEIFAWLDERTREKVRKFLMEIHTGGGLTTLLVSHEREMLKGLCSRILYMEEGKIVRQEISGDVDTG